MLYLLLKPLAIFIFKFFFKTKVKGRRHIPSSGGVVIASNHLSYLDPVVLGVASPRRLYFMAKEELFKIPLFSMLIKNLGAFPVRRNFQDIKAIRKAIRLIREGKALVIFPQGTRTSSLRSPSWPGIGLIIKKTSCRVICSRLEGTDKVLPKGSKRIGLKNLKVIFSEPLLFREKDPRVISERIVESIYSLN